jgi:hypothetical protein
MHSCFQEQQGWEVKQSRCDRVFKKIQLVNITFDMINIVIKHNQFT